MKKCDRSNEYFPKPRSAVHFILPPSSLILFLRASASLRPGGSLNLLRSPTSSAPPGNRPFRPARNIVYENHDPPFPDACRSHRRGRLRELQHQHAAHGPYAQRRLSKGPFGTVHLDGLRRPARPPRATVEPFGWRGKRNRRAQSNDG